MIDRDWISPHWPAPASVRAVVTTRAGGFSGGAYAGLNLATHVGDDVAVVERNRAVLRNHIGATPVWLEQVHGVSVVDAAVHRDGPPPGADGAYTREIGVACAVLTADCLPVLFCDRSGTVVAAAHAGWRGLCAGVLEATLRAMAVPPGEVLAWLGPAIGPHAFEVGEEVVHAFVGRDPTAAHAFTAGARPGKWWGDLFALARQRLVNAGVGDVSGGGVCTRADRGRRFYSYRGEGRTGRFASLVWLQRSR